MDLRVSDEDKDLIAASAALERETVSTFVIKAALERAARVRAKHAARK